MIVIIEKKIAVHNDLTNLEFHLNPVGDSTLNLNSILIH